MKASFLLKQCLIPSQENIIENICRGRCPRNGRAHASPVSRPSFLGCNIAPSISYELPAALFAIVKHKG